METCTVYEVRIRPSEMSLLKPATEVMYRKYLGAIDMALYMMKSTGHTEGALNTETQAPRVTYCPQVALL